MRSKVSSVCGRLVVRSRSTQPLWVTGAIAALRHIYNQYYSSSTKYNQANARPHLYLRTHVGSFYRLFVVELL